MSVASDLDVLKVFGQVAAPAGIAIGAFLYLGKDIVARNIFPALTRQQAYRVIMALSFMAWTVALAGIAAWTYVSVSRPPGPVSPQPTNSANTNLPLPGDTGWIFAGYYDIAREVFIEGPYVSVQSTTKRGQRRFVEIGDIVGLNVSRDVHIVDYKRQGVTQKFVSPINKSVIDEYDKTGIALPAGTKLIVRDVSEGRWEQSPRAALWLRVVHVPR